MPFNAFGVFQRLFRWQTDRDNGIEIRADRMDAEMDGIADGLTEIVQGTQPFTGAVRTIDGSAAQPAFSFSGDNSTGVYRALDGSWRVVIGGAEKLTVSSAGVDTPAITTQSLQVNGQSPLLPTDNAAITGQWEFAGDTTISGQLAVSGQTLHTAQVHVNYGAPEVRLTDSNTGHSGRIVSAGGRMVVQSSSPDGTSDNGTIVFAGRNNADLAGLLVRVDGRDRAVYHTGMAVQRTFAHEAALIGATDLNEGDIVATAGYAAPGDYGGNVFRIVPAGTGSAPIYLDLSSGLQAQRLFPGGVVTPEQFGAVPGANGQVIADAIEAAAQAAAHIHGRVVFTRSYAPARNVVLKPGVTYDFGDAGEIDLRNTPIPNNPYVSYYHEPGVSVEPGSEGAAVSLAADIREPRSLPIQSITASGGTATLTTYEPHGFAVGDYIWVLYPGGWSQSLEDAGAFYFICQQNSSHEMLALTVPHKVLSVPAANELTFAVDTAAPSNFSMAQSCFVAANSIAAKLADTSGFSAGNYVLLRTNRDVPVYSGSQTIKYAEIQRIERVSGDWLIFSETVGVDYLVAENARLAPLNLAPPVRFVRPRIRGRGSSGITTPSYGQIDAAGDIGLQVHLNECAIIEGAEITDCERVGIDIQRNFVSVINEADIQLYSTNDGGRQTGLCPLPYGINYGSYCRYVHISGVRGTGNTRHWITEATDGSFGGYTQFVTIRDCMLHGGLSDMVTTHYPNRGYVAENIRGEGLGNVAVLECRSGKLIARNIEGHGVDFVVYAYGHSDEIDVRDIRGYGISGAAVFIAPSSALNTHLSITARDIRVRGAKRAFYMYWSGGGTNAQATIDIDGVDAHDCTTAPVRVNTVPSAFLSARNINGCNVCTSYDSYLISVSDSVWGVTENLTSTPTISRRVPEDAEIRFERRGKHGGFEREDVIAQITNGAVEVVRGDDFVLTLRGEGYSADDLDQITGMRHGQIITLQRYSEAITVRDGSSSGLGADGIQTRNSADVVLDSSYKCLHVQCIGAAGSKYVVETARSEG